MGKSKKIALIFIALHFIWEILDLTGLSFGNMVFVVSAFIDEPIDVVFIAVYAVTIALFLWREKVGKWAVFAFLVAAAGVQGTIYFRKDFSGYYGFFANENTHRIFPENPNFLVKDTYHIIMDLLILSALISVAAFLILSKQAKRKPGNK
jgi:hypothetical protein